MIRLAAAAFLALGIAAAQSEPPKFLYRHLQAFEAPARFTPQTKRERFHAYLRNLAGPVTLITEAGAAGISQAIDHPWQWGSGGEGFAKRFANDMSYNATRFTLAYVTASLLNEDDRYFLSRDREGWRRARHAIASVFTAHKPDGTTAFATSSAIGIVGASLLSRTWSPRMWQTPSATVRSIGISLSGSAALNIVREFLPAYVHRRAANPAAPRDTPQ